MVDHQRPAEPARESFELRAMGGEAQTIEADNVLVSIGRRPNTDGLALDKAGLTLPRY